MTALRPEPQTLLMVTAGIVAGKPGMDHGLAPGGLPRAALQHVAHDDVVDAGGVITPARRHRLPDGDRAELRRGKGGEPAQVFPDRRAAGGEDDGRGGVGHVRSRWEAFDETSKAGLA